MSDKSKAIEYSIDELLTPTQMADGLEDAVGDDRGYIISRELYQPLLSVIRNLDVRVKELEKRNV